MKSILYPGDIIMAKNLMFKDNNKIDTRLNGHPMLVLNNVENINDIAYCLHVSSNYAKDLKHYYEIKLSKDCYIDLKYVYKIECKVQMEVKETINEKKFKEVVDKMTKLHETGKVEESSEYEEFYNKYILIQKNRYNLERIIREIEASCRKARTYYKLYLSEYRSKVKRDLYNELTNICIKAIELANFILDAELPREEAFEALKEKNIITKNTCKTLKKIISALDKFDISQETYGLQHELTEEELDDFVTNKINVIWQYALSLRDYI